MIKINEKYYISADTNCYALKKKVIVQNESSKNFGEEKFTDIGFYSSIESLLRGFIKETTREYVRKDELNSIKELQQYIKELEVFIKSLGLDY